MVVVKIYTFFAWNPNGNLSIEPMSSSEYTEDQNDFRSDEGLQTPPAVIRTAL